MTSAVQHNDVFLCRPVGGYNAELLDEVSQIGKCKCVSVCVCALACTSSTYVQIAMTRGTGVGEWMLKGLMPMPTSSS